MYLPRLPIIIDDNGDINFFETLARVSYELEAIDVENDEYEAFDARGCVLTLLADEGEVRIVVPPVPVFHPDELAVRLKRYIERVGAHRFDGLPADLATARLEELVSSVERFLG